MKKDILISNFLKNLNKKILKKINFSLVLILMCVNLYAQEIDYSNPILKQKSSPKLHLLDSIYENAPYIFKGTVIDYTWNKYLKDGEIYYKSYLIRIDEVYKGEQTLKEGTIELIVEFKRNRPMYFSDIGKSFIWACKKSDIQKKYFSPSNSTNLSVFYYHNEPRGIPTISCIIETYRKAENLTYYFDYHVWGFHLFFKTKNELDEFLNNRYSLKPSKPFSNPKLEKEKKKRIQKNKRLKKKNRKKQKVWEERIKERNLLKSRNNKSINTERDIEFGFDNIEVTENENGNYLEFDITAKTNTTPSYLHFVLLTMKYESDINGFPFNTYIENDLNDFSLTYTDDFLESSYELSPSHFDYNEDNEVILILVATENSFLTQIDFYPKSLMRVKMRINDVNVAKSIMQTTTNIEIITSDWDYMVSYCEEYQYNINSSTTDQDFPVYFPITNPYPMPLTSISPPPPGITSYHIEDANNVNLGTTGANI